MLQLLSADGEGGSQSVFLCGELKVMPSGWELREDALSPCLTKDGHQNWRRPYCWVCGWMGNGRAGNLPMDGWVGVCTPGASAQI